MKICEGIETIGLGLYLQKYKALVISDLHLGIEEAAEKVGILLPRFHYKNTVKMIKAIFENLASRGFQVRTVVINGDMKQEFGEILSQEWREILNLVDFLLERCQEVVLVKGNHDVFLDPIAKKKGLKVVDAYSYEDVLITHGHSLPKTFSKKIKTIIIGNEHPAVSFREGPKVEKYKCFLKGRWNGRTMIVLPSFTTATIGNDILYGKMLSPFLQKMAGEFEIFVFDEKNFEILYFGRTKDLL
ncbi:MAG: metallophosphoesterase [Candidatus Woesearchaeota archaeon]